MHAAQKNKAAAAAAAAAASAATAAPSAPQIHAMLQQLSEDVEVLLQEGSHGEALRQLQSVSSHLSSRISRADPMHAVHHTSTRSSLALMHLAAVAEDTCPEERAVAGGEGKNGTARSVRKAAVKGTATVGTPEGAAARPGLHAVAASRYASMHTVNGCTPDRQHTLSRARRDVTGQPLLQRNGRFALQRSDSFAGVQHGLSESTRHSGSLPNSPARNSGMLVHSERSTLSDALSDGPHGNPLHHTQPSEGTPSAGEMQLPLLSSSSLPAGVNGGAGAADDATLPSAGNSSDQADVVPSRPVTSCSHEQAYSRVNTAHSHQDAATVQKPQPVLSRERVLYHASGPAPAAAVRDKEGHKAHKQHRGVLDEELQQAAACGGSEEAGGAAGAHARAELSTIFNALDGLRDSETEPLYSTVDSCGASLRCETYGLRPRADACHQNDGADQVRGLQDRARSEGEPGSEAGADIGEDSVPLVHALVLRVLNQFAMTRAPD